MGLELLRDGITDEKISKIEAEVEQECKNEEDILKYIGRSRGELEKHQDLLVGFLRREGKKYGVLDHPLFAFASVLTFKVLPEELTLERLKTGVFRVVRRDIREHAHTRRGNLFIDLGWLGDKLGTVCPAYLNWLNAIVDNLENPEEKTAFSLGAYFTIMPFFSREEARDMEKRFNI